MSGGERKEIEGGIVSGRRVLDVDDGAGSPGAGGWSSQELDQISKGSVDLHRWDGVEISAALAVEGDLVVVVELERDVSAGDRIALHHCVEASNGSAARVGSIGLAGVPHSPTTEGLVAGIFDDVALCPINVVRLQDRSGWGGGVGDDFGARVEVEAGAGGLSLGVDAGKLIVDQASGGLAPVDEIDAVDRAEDVVAGPESACSEVIVEAEGLAGFGLRASRVSACTPPEGRPTPVSVACSG
jgi:hypothetical protein